MDQDLHSMLHTPTEELAISEESWLVAEERASRDIWLVGSKEGVVAAAKALGDFVGEPVIARQAELMEADYAGTKREVTWMAGNLIRRATLLVIPDGASRIVSPCRPDIISKQLQGKVAGQDVVLAVREQDVVAATLAVCRCVTPFNAKLKRKPNSTCVIRYHGCTVSSALVQKLKTMADSVRVAQGLVDMPPNKLTTTEFKDFVVSTATGIPGVSHAVIEGEELQQRGYGGLWNVGKCAETPPCLVVLSLEGTGKGVALVGKGITFDTGGAALKSKEGMCGMKGDMGGAAGCFGAWLAIARAGGLPSGKPVHCVLCIACNSIGSRCFVQDDIITQYSGLTVEINNTDAEGRLVLGDGVSHVAKHLDCDLVFDMATLTGAQGISTGKHHALILATDDDLERSLMTAGLASGDMVHPGLFAPELLIHEFDSEVADMKNSVKDRGNAQSSCAGLFVHRHLTHSGYTGRWVHIDMASPSTGPFGKERAAGWGVGLLCRYLGLDTAA